MPERFSKTILIVDDDRVFLDSLEQFILQRGYHCKVAWDADSALRIIRDFSLDVVVADVVMPDRDGLWLMQEAKILEPDLDFIFMTGYSYDYSYVEIINAGAADYITKPFEMLELIARIERLDREKRLIRELRNTNARLKKTVEQVNSMMAEVNQSARAKNNLLADVSHEIRTPLTGILGFADILMTTDLNTEQNSYARNIKMSGEIILSLINDFLDSAKVEAGRMELENIPFDPQEVCYEACDLIRPRLYGKPVELLCRVDRQVPVLLCGDPHRFRQVLLNLMSNAVKFTREGEIELALKTEPLGREDDRVQVKVSLRDTGMGIKPDKREAIFEPFRQSMDSISREYGGTGLGLFLCRKISELMGGDIKVDSSPGQGSTFYFFSQMDVIEETRPDEPSDIAALSGKKAVLVIPNRTGREIVSQMLEGAGLSLVVAAESCQAAQKQTDGEKTKEFFDFCIVDADPVEGGENGCDFFKQGLHPSSTGRIPSVIALVEPLMNNANLYRQAGCAVVLNKPVRRQELTGALKSLLESPAAVKESGEDKHAFRAEAVNPSTSSKGLILLAEDNPVNQKLVAAMLEKAGYRVTVVPDGQKAVDRFLSAPDSFRLILMDVQMPEMDGISATKAIRQWEKQQQEEGRSRDGGGRIPIIAITAGAANLAQVPYGEAGMDGLLVKPIRRDSLLETIDAWFGR